VRIQNRIDYAVRALVVLAGATGPCTRRDLADSARVPDSYLGSILQELSRVELVRGTRGPRGGYRLAREASTISVADVIAALDDTDVVFDPVSPIAGVWDRLHRTLLEEAERVHLADLRALLAQGESVPDDEPI
jgi:Rrf2 family protein